MLPFSYFLVRLGHLGFLSFSSRKKITTYIQVGSSRVGSKPHPTLDSEWIYSTTYYYNTFALFFELKGPVIELEWRKSKSFHREREEEVT